MTFRPDQVEYLLRPIQPHRVLKSKDVYGSFLAQHDVRAHLNRIFGFGNWGTRVVESVCVAEEKNAKGNWQATYRVTVALAIFDENGDEEISYEDSAAATSMRQPDRGQAHHLGITDATSTALKRAATCLGDQFGLSLYNGGSIAPFVGGTLAWPDAGENPELEEGIVEAEVVSEGSEASTPVDDAPVGADLQPAEQPGRSDSEQPQESPYSEFEQQWLDKLKDVMAMPDAAERVRLVGMLKAEPVDLGKLIRLNNGAVMTFDALADNIATGALVTRGGAA